VIEWLLQSGRDNGEIAQGVDLPGLLSAGEAATLAELQVLKRRRDWLTGRWTAKQLLQRVLSSAGQPASFDQIVIENDADGAPFATLVDGGGARRLDWNLSISHSHGVGFCAVHPITEEGNCYAIGADLEFIETRATNFVRDYFTPAEMELVAQASAAEQPALVTAIWSAKEAILKALRTGLRLDTRTIQCLMPGALPVTDEWQVFTLEIPDELAPGATWHGWWRRPLQHPDFILTLVIKTEIGEPSLDRTLI
jgi:4'-phosphopantetheinyl transferase